MRKGSTSNHRLSTPPDSLIRRGWEIGKTGWAGTMEYTHLTCKECGNTRWRESRRLTDGITLSGLCQSCFRQSHPLAGDKNPNWKGGRHPCGKGYMDILVPRGDFFYPMVTRHSSDLCGYCAEHRLVMAKHINRCLLPWEIVHHINGIRDDNRLENLELIKGKYNHAPYNILQQQVAKLKKENEILKKRLSKYEVL